MSIVQFQNKRKSNFNTVIQQIEKHKEISFENMEKINRTTL